MSDSLKAAAVVGAGSWGTALAAVLAEKGHQVNIWALEPEVVDSINRERVNHFFLQDIKLPQGITAHGDLGLSLEGADLVVMVTPSHVMRGVLEKAAKHLSAKANLVLCSKGIEHGTSYTMDEVAEDVLPKAFSRRVSCLSGPSFARDVAKGVPTAVTVASWDMEVAQAVQMAFAGPRFRVYTSPDVRGVELGGAVKNPLAIAAGMVDGLGLGGNTVAALITRGLAEMTRLAVARGGQMVTMSGLAGLGDLVLTCTGALSRNRTVGQRLAQGETIEQITSSTRTVAEGVKNTPNILAMARKSGVDMPIVRAVQGVISGEMTAGMALEALMTRELKQEHY